MTSFSHEMLRFLQPELLQPEEMIDILVKRGVPLKQLKPLDPSALTEVFKNTAVPKPQRQKPDSRRMDTAKIKNRITINSEADRTSSSGSKYERSLSSSNYSAKNCSAGMDRLKPPPDLSKSGDNSSCERLPASSRLKPPPDLSQPEAKKIKLNRASSDSLDHIFIKDKSKTNDTPNNNGFKLKSSVTNGTKESSCFEEENLSNGPVKKVTLKRNIDSSPVTEGPPKKRQPITWP